MVWVQAVEHDHFVLAFDTISSFKLRVLHIEDRYESICIVTGLELWTLVILAFNPFVLL